LHIAHGPLTHFFHRFAKVATDDAERDALNVSAIEVLVDRMKALERAKEFAERVNVKDCWSKLASAQLGEGMIHDAITSYCKSEDATNYTAVIAAAEAESNYDDLCTYLIMARASIKENELDTALIYAYAKTEKISDLEQLVSSPNVANIMEIGERCFGEGLYDAAKILFESINNNAKLALCYVNIGNYREAVDAATKANAISTWKEVNIACVKDEEFR
jgi:clathrin heavy chain